MRKKIITICGTTYICKKIKFIKNNIYMEYKVKDIGIVKSWILNVHINNTKDEYIIKGKYIRIKETNELYKDKNGNGIRVYILKAMPKDNNYKDFGLKVPIPYSAKVTNNA